MRTSLRRTLSPLVLCLGLAGCQTTDNDATNTNLPAAPAGETATVSFAQTQSQTTFVETDWLIDQANVNGAATSHFKVRLVYSVDATQATLAAECVRSNWQTACELAQRTIANANPTDPSLQTAGGQKLWEANLRQQFTETLFPCNNGAPLANVTGIVWRVDAE